MSFKPEVAFSQKPVEMQASFTEKDAIIYALSIGYNRDPMNTQEFKYTFEMKDNFSTFPTYCCVLNKDIKIEQMIADLEGVPKFNPMMLVHGEQTVEMFRQLVPGVQYYTTGELYDVQEKAGRKGTVFSYKLSGYEIDENKQKHLAFTMIVSDFVRKLSIGGFQGRYPKAAFPKPPQRQPDFIVDEKTREDQALLYRLNGDYNPLHIDPSQAAQGGFERPILHGLCFYGIAAKVVSQKVLQGRSELIQKIQFRFTSSVFPGETLQFLIWRDGPNRVIVTAKTLERGHVVISGFIEFKQQPKL